MSKLLFDGDVIVYAVGFACESRAYVVTDKDTGLTYELSSIREARKIASDPDDIEMTQEALPEHVALDRMDNLITAAMRKLEGDEHEIYLTSENPKHNFRYEWAKTLPYKGNRKGIKPKHYKYIREKLVTEYGARVIRGHEADDELGINQTEDSIIVSVDKDLLMVPGKHYNLRTKETVIASDPGNVEVVTNTAGSKRLKGTGFMWFCAQMLLGDAIDNIQGIKGQGPVKVFKALHELTDPKEMWSKVCDIYISKDMEALIEENSELLWISRNDYMRFKDYKETEL